MTTPQTSNKISADDALLLRPHAEQRYAEELAALARLDERTRPASWRLLPWAVVTYLMGGMLEDGTIITPKDGKLQPRMVETSVNYEIGRASCRERV